MPPTRMKKDSVVARSRRRTVEGVVTSDKMHKTITVRIERLVKHPEFEKRLRRYGICYAHDEKNEARRGDRVELMETRPLSKLKNWRLLRVVARAAAAPDRDAREAARPVKDAETAEPAPPPSPAV